MLQFIVLYNDLIFVLIFVAFSVLCRFGAYLISEGHLTAGQIFTVSDSYLV